MAEPILMRELSRYTMERALLLSQGHEEFTGIIREIGFSCTCCGRCCTTGFNGHVFLLEEDTERAVTIDPDAIIPAPFFDICDNTGTFYVSGYALRADQEGICIFLRDGRCSIYEDRFSICRVYPYMMHREADERGKLDFRQFSGLDLHGEYHRALDPDEAARIADETIAYEQAWLSQIISFYEALILLFSREGLKPVRKMYDRQIARMRNGESCTVQVWHQGSFHPHTVTREDYTGFGWI